MTSYHSFLQSIFGNRYTLYAPYIYSLNLYCLFVITLTVSLCVYSLLGYQDVCDQSFQQRVHLMRVKYAAVKRPGND